MEDSPKCHKYVPIGHKRDLEKIRHIQEKAEQLSKKTRNYLMTSSPETIQQAKLKIADAIEEMERIISLV